MPPPLKHGLQTACRCSPRIQQSRCPRAYRNASASCSSSYGCGGRCWCWTTWKPCCRQERARLVQAYAGNPLALKIAAETIADLFAGKIGLFLKQGMVLFGGIGELLAEQVVRLSAMEQTALGALAIGREPLSLEELQAL